MFRNRGRPPDPLPIGGYEQPTVEENNQIPVHQLGETPRQLPLAPVRELERDIVMQQQPTETGNVLVRPKRRNNHRFAVQPPKRRLRSHLRGGCFRTTSAVG